MATPVIDLKTNTALTKLIPNRLYAISTPVALNNNVS